MNHWRFDECSVAFYYDGIEKSGYDVVDALNAAESRIAELEAEVTKGHELQDSYCDRIAELEGKIDQLTAHSDIERQDDNYSNHTQTQTIVYQKECEE